MRLIKFITLLALILGGAWYFWGEEADIDPQLLDKIKLPDSLADKIKIKESAENEKDAAVYKWQDKHGNWHYGDQPPQGTDAIPVTVFANQISPATTNTETDNSEKESPATTHTNEPTTNQ